MRTHTLRVPLALAAALLSLAGPVALFAEDPSLSDPALFELYDGSTGGGPKPCGLGTRVECGTITEYRCTEFRLQPSASVTGSSWSYICAASITKTTKLYRDD